MPNFNFVVLVGYLTRDIEFKVVSRTQVALAESGIGVNKRLKNRAGEVRESVMFIDFEAWGPVAEQMSRDLAKGQPVMLEGSLKLDQWQDAKSGVKRYKHKLLVETFHKLGAPAPSEEVEQEVESHERE